MEKLVVKKKLSNWFVDKALKNFVFIWEFWQKFVGDHFRVLVFEIRLFKERFNFLAVQIFNFCAYFQTIFCFLRISQYFLLLNTKTSLTFLIHKVESYSSFSILLSFVKHTLFIISLFLVLCGTFAVLTFFYNFWIHRNYIHLGMASKTFCFKLVFLENGTAKSVQTPWVKDR